MTRTPVPFVWSDAWLLLSLIYAHANGPAGRAAIIHAGDHINRAIFADEEFEGGIQRLKARGLVAEDKNLYSPTLDVLEWYAKACPGRGSIYEDLERVEGFLGLARDA